MTVLPIYDGILSWLGDTLISKYKDKNLEDGLIPCLFSTLIVNRFRSRAYDLTSHGF